jgi:mRNA interferase RelE/StbE
VPDNRYRVTLTTAARRSLRRLDRPVRNRVLDALATLGANPRPQGAQTLQGGEGLLRVRVGDYRVIYTVDEDQIVVLVVALGHRSVICRER